MKPAIRVENLSKQYRIGTRSAGEYSTLRESLMDALAAPIRRLRSRGQNGNGPDRFWALKDVSFEVQPGEIVGIIGRNGAGKSTLLKILSRIVEPTEGRAEIRGRMGSLLEVGTGFHQELTGRENIYLNGSILGMGHREIARKFDEIVAFSEIEQFLDTPVKRYSSGMYVRLAFAVAAHLEPEILIVDEVLAVGDVEFQKKCMAKMRTVAQTGHTVLLVSHNLAAVEKLCDRAMTLHLGKVIGYDDAKNQIRQYMNMFRTTREPTVDLTSHPLRSSAALPILTGLSISSDGSPGTVVQMGGRVDLEIRYEVPERPRNLHVGVVIENLLGVKVVAFSPTFECPELLLNAPPCGTIQVRVPWLNLVEGEYFVNVYAQTERGWDSVEQASQIQVLASDVFKTGSTLDSKTAATFLPSRWSTSWSRGTTVKNSP